jgi:hypothetical protein
MPYLTTKLVDKNSFITLGPQSYFIRQTILFVCLIDRLTVCLTACLPTYFPTYLLTCCLLACLLTYLPAWLTARLHACLSVYLFAIPPSYLIINQSNSFIFASLPLVLYPSSSLFLSFCLSVPACYMSEFLSFLYPSVYFLT